MLYDIAAPSSSMSSDIGNTKKTLDHVRVMAMGINQRLHEGKDRDTDFAGSGNPCIGFRGEDKAAGKIAVQPRYAASFRAGQG